MSLNDKRPSKYICVDLHLPGKHVEFRGYNLDMCMEMLAVYCMEVGYDGWKSKAVSIHSVVRKWPVGVGANELLGTVEL